MKVVSGFFLFLSLTVLLLASCSTKEILPASVEGGYEYYPVNIGNSWIYQVDTIGYRSRFVSANNQIVTDTSRGRFFLRELIADSIGLQQGNALFRVEIYRSADSLGPWTIDSVWSIQRGQDKILKTENNRPIVKLKFPLQQGSRWDGNQYNSLQDSSETNWFTVKELNKNFSFRNNFYPSAFIIGKSDSSCLGKIRYTERYLKGIGPAFIQKTSLIYSQEGPDPCGNLPRIESGKERNYTLIKFEKGS